MPISRWDTVEERIHELKDRITETSMIDMKSYLTLEFALLDSSLVLVFL